MIRTVNCGIVENIDGMNIEILSHKFHNPYCNIVCYYYVDRKTGRKTEVTYYKDIETGREGHEVYKFKNADDVCHYRSYNYSIDKLPKKYQEIANKLINIHSQINFDEYTNRLKH